MKFYTIEELTQDIKKFEGSEDFYYTENPDVMVSRLYSEVFDKPVDKSLGEKEWEEALVLRISNFFEEHLHGPDNESYAIPLVDRQPDPEDRVSLYSGDWERKRATYVKGFKSIEEFDDFAPSIHFEVFFVVSHQSGAVFWCGQGQTAGVTLH